MTITSKYKQINTKSKSPPPPPPQIQPLMDVPIPGVWIRLYLVILWLPFEPLHRSLRISWITVSQTLMGIQVTWSSC